MGRTRYVPGSTEDTKVVERGAALGFRLDQIARLVNVSVPTLRRAYREILATAQTKLNLRIASTLVQVALEERNAQALIFLAKTRLHWCENDRHELIGSDAQSPAIALTSSISFEDEGPGEPAPDDEKEAPLRLEPPKE